MSAALNEFDVWYENEYLPAFDLLVGNGISKHYADVFLADCIDDGWPLMNTAQNLVTAYVPTNNVIQFPRVGECE